MQTPVPGFVVQTERSPYKPQERFLERCNLRPNQTANRTEREIDAIQALTRNLSLIEECCPIRQIQRIAGAAVLLLDASEVSDELDCFGISIALRVLNDQAPETLARDIFQNADGRRNDERSPCNLHIGDCLSSEQATWALLSIFLNMSSNLVFAPCNEDARRFADSEIDTVALYSSMMAGLFKQQGWMSEEK